MQWLSLVNATVCTVLPVMAIMLAVKRIGSSLEAAPVVHVTDADLMAALEGLDLAEICITSAISVVAEEVRALAFRTQESTGQIEQLISSLQHKAEAAVSNMDKSASLADSTLESADDAGDAINAINSAVGSIQQMNQQIAAAVEQQTAVAHDIDRNIVEINHAGERTAEGAHQTEDDSRALSAQVVQLKQLIGAFRV